MIIAIDGPAGSGKSTVAKIVAEKLNFSYLDTGAMYRMVTLYNALNEGDFENPQVVIDSLKNINIKIEDGNFYLNDELVNDAIRSQDITRNVSYIASIKEVREFLVEQQREIGKTTNCILDGRDIASVVFPNADFKFFLTASPEVRAKRRFDQVKGTDNEEALDVILKDIIKRDEFDSTRKESPLIMVEDAVKVDTDNLSLQDVCNVIIEKVGI